MIILLNGFVGENSAPISPFKLVAGGGGGGGQYTLLEKGGQDEERVVSLPLLIW